MKKYITILLTICILFSFSYAYASASYETKEERFIAYGVSYTYDASVINESLFNDKDIAEIFDRVKSEVLKDVTREPAKLSTFLSSQEISTLEVKGIVPSDIDVSVVEALVTLEPLHELLRGPDTVSYTRGVNYTFLNTQGSSTFNVGATWNVHKPTGAITIISNNNSPWLHNVSGPSGQSFVYGVGNKLYPNHYFSNGSGGQRIDFRFRLTASGGIVREK